jgi:predicted alpha/beta superfamily hydrolase
MRNTLFVLIFIFSLAGFSQNSIQDNVVGVNLTINSKFLKENRKIQVYLPDGYSKSNKKYPVIYLLDGQRYFLYGVTLDRLLKHFRKTPDFIVVGIDFVESKRNTTLFAGSKMFSNYIENEVVPFVNKTYRTSNKRLLFGWEFSGGFGLATLMSKPGLFDGYILSSPYPLTNKMDKFKEFAGKQNKLNTFLYFSDAGEAELPVTEGTKELANFLKKNTTSLRWGYKSLKGEEHISTKYSTLHHGIKEYFENYVQLNFKDLNEFNSKGGVASVRAYYEKRSRLYEISTEIIPAIRYNYIRLAVRADNYDEFSKLSKEFNLKDLVSNRLRPSLLCAFGEYYIKKNKKKEAKIFYKILIKRFPKSERVKEGLQKVKNL